MHRIHRGGKSLTRIINDSSSICKDVRNQRKQLARIVQKLGVKNFDDLYTVHRTAVYLKVPFTSTCYTKNFHSTLQSIHPNHTCSKRSATPTQWKSVEIKRAKLDQLAEQLGIKCLDDWYNVQRTKVYNKASFIQNHYSTLSAALQAIYPEHPWDHSRFSHTLSGYWKSISNQKKRMEEIAKELNIKQLDDWYKVSRQQIYSKAPFISRYYSSLFSALKAIYPEHPWNELHMSRIPCGALKVSNDQLIEFVNHTMNKYRIQKRDDWHRLTPKEWKLVRLAGSKFASVGAMLKALYPRWDSPYSKPEILLQKMLKSVTRIKPQAKIERYSTDIFLPEWDIAIEYQGNHHFQQGIHGLVSDQMDRDRRKLNELKRLGISVIQVGYWWDGSWSHLRSTLLKNNPCMLFNTWLLACLITLTTHTALPLPTAVPYGKLRGVNWKVDMII